MKPRIVIVFIVLCIVAMTYGVSHQASAWSEPGLSAEVTCGTGGWRIIWVVRSPEPHRGEIWEVVAPNGYFPNSPQDESAAFTKVVNLGYDTQAMTETVTVAWRRIGSQITWTQTVHVPDTCVLPPPPVVVLPPPVVVTPQKNVDVVIDNENNVEVEVVVNINTPTTLPPTTTSTTTTTSTSTTTSTTTTVAETLPPTTQMTQLPETGGDVNLELIGLGLIIVGALFVGITVYSRSK